MIRMPLRATASDTRAPKVKIEDLIIDVRCQARDGLDETTVAEYTAIYEEGGTLPPVSVYQVDGELYVVDGFHRLEAADRAGVSFPRADTVGAGSMDDAIWFATGVNKTHGLRRSSADKRRAVWCAVTSEIGQAQSLRDIAAHVGVSHSLVREIRSAWEESQTAQNRVNDDTTGGVYLNTPPGPPESLWNQDPTREPGSNPPEEPPDTEPEIDPRPSYTASLEAMVKETKGLRRRMRAQLIGRAPTKAVERALDSLAAAAATLAYAVPAVHQDCAGAGCKGCSGHGWVEAGSLR